MFMKFMKTKSQYISLQLIYSMCAMQDAVLWGSKAALLQ